MSGVLPDAGISRVIGFLEVLHDNNDEDDTVHLASHLDLELDMLLPVINAAELLGLIELKSGRVAITAAGKRLVEADLLKRRVLFKERVAGVDIFKKVTGLISARRSKKIKKKSLLKYFKTTLPDADAETTVRRIIDWGRHSELLGYDSNTDEIYLIKE